VAAESCGLKIIKRFLMLRGERDQFPSQKDESRVDQFQAWHILVLILFIAFALRFVHILQPQVIHSDGIEYIRHARQVLSGGWADGKAPPLYPTLIALTSLITKDYEIAGIWVSVFLGTLTILPVFYLGRAIFNEIVAAISALFVAVQPSLFISSGSVLTESTYHFLIATAVFLGWKAFSEGKSYHVFLFGLIAALAYLTRPEAIGFLFIHGVWVLLFNPPQGKRSWLKRVGIIFLAVLGFVALSSPYLIQIRKETGKWSISRKADISIRSPSAEEDLASGEGIKTDARLALLPLVKNPLNLLAKVGVGLLDSLYRFQQAYHPILFIFAILGWIGIIKKGSLYALKANFYILTYHFFFFGFVFPFFLVSRRYTSQMIPFSIPWTTFGLLIFMDWVYQRRKFVVSKEKFATILLIILSIMLLVQDRVSHKREHRFIRREAGFWMKGHLPREGKIMSRLPQEAFYAGLPWVRIPEGNYGEILQVARSNGVRYLIIDEEIEKDSPGFWDKLKGKELIFLKDLKKNDQRMVVFEIVYSEKTEP
jgi:4-amino-4-deoxy-L-arabinose transferase-like glycosyltransferase